MLGAIIGDVVGSRWEFNPTNDYDFELFSEENGFTDDTICTVAVAEAIWGIPMKLRNQIEYYLPDDMIHVLSRFHQERPHSYKPLIDVSKMMQLLSESEAVEELGIGRVRDHFSKNVSPKE